MRHAIRSTLLGLLVAGMSLVAGPYAEAGVKGGAFEGEFSNDSGFSRSCAAEFFQNGEFSFTQDLDTSPTTYFGTYTEINLGIISFWSAEGTDPTPDGVFELRGICILGLVTTLTVDNEDIGVLDRGSMVRTGFATPPPPPRKGR